MNRVLIIGASGVLGSNLAMELREDACVYGTYHSHRFRINRVPMFHLDVCQEKSLIDLLTNLRPDIVFYCAAIRDEKQCTENAIQALTVNAEAVNDVALCLRGTGGRLIYFSTSKVFSGQKGDYLESDEPDPSTSYGIAKLRGEQSLVEFENTFILRLGTLFGFGPNPRDSLLCRLLTQLWSGKETGFVSDELRTFQSVSEVVEAAKRLMHCGPEKAGLYHCPGGSKQSYFEFARSLAKALEVPTEGVIPVAGESMVAPFNTAELRGRDTSLKAEKFVRSLGSLGTPLSDSLIHLKNQLFTGKI